MFLLGPLYWSDTKSPRQMQMHISDLAEYENKKHIIENHYRIYNESEIDMYEVIGPDWYFTQIFVFKDDNSDIAEHIRSTYRRIRKVHHYPYSKDGHPFVDEYIDDMFKRTLAYGDGCGCNDRCCDEFIIYEWPDVIHKLIQDGYKLNDYYHKIAEEQ